MQDFFQLFTPPNCNYYMGLFSNVEKISCID